MPPSLLCCGSTLFLPSLVGLTSVHSSFSSDTYASLLTLPGASAWSHPIVRLPCILLIMLCLSGTLVLVSGGHFYAWVILVVSIASATAFFTTLAIVWLLGTFWCLDKGPWPDSGEYTPFHVDALQLHQGVLGMSMAPGRKRKTIKRNLAADIARIRTDLHFDVIVTLLEDRELQVMECSEMGACVAEHGMLWLHFPVREKWIPCNSKAFLAEVVEPITLWLREGKRVLVHCNGGKGRTGMVVTSVLMTSTGEHLGVESFSGALKVMRACRPNTLRSPWQQLFVHHIQSSLRAL